jgi:hypothetical protein
MNIRQMIRRASRLITNARASTRRSSRPFNLASSFTSYANPLTPAEKLLILILLISIRDKASELRFDPHGRDNRLEYELWEKINGIYYEMVPPPTFMVVEVFDLVLRLGDLDVESWHDQAFVTIGVGDLSVDLLLVRSRTWLGYRLMIYLLSAEHAVGVAQEIIQRHVSRERKVELGAFDFTPSEIDEAELKL